MAALADRLEAMRIGGAASEAFRNAQRDRMLAHWKQDPTAVRTTAKGPLEGTKITVLAKYARFYAYVGEELKSFRLLLSPAQLARAEQAVLRFVPNGIRLADERGNDLGFFLPVDRMPLMKGQDCALQTVWRDQRCFVTPDEEVVIPSTPEKAHLKVAPIDESDAIYIFKLWLNRRAPLAIPAEPRSASFPNGSRPIMA
ncbi:hypothetical protein HDU90_008797 [Geranomyces variabilis]|nr:hypothetical protein HDU90_008797 [Geranomyces variabilis]